MDLEARRQQLLSRMNALKQQEQALESFMASNEKEQIEAIDLFKNDLNVALSSLTTIPANFAIASKQIGSVYSLASDLSFRIKEVDTAISRCSQTADYVRHFADLHECFGSIDKYIEQKNIPKSCDYVHRLLQIPESLLTNEDSQKIKNSRKATLILLQEEFEKETNDPIQVFLYFTQIDAQKEGIIQFANAHHKKILDEIHDDRISLIQLQPASITVAADTRAPHVEVYVKLLNSISSHILSSILPLSEPGQFSVFIRILLERVDGKIEELITKYSEYRKLAELERQSSQEMNKLAVIDLVNDEISIFAHQYSLFEGFLGQKIIKGIESPFFKSYKPNFTFATTAATGLPRNTLSARAIQEVLAQYAVLTQSYIMSVTAKLLKTVGQMEKTSDVTDAIDDLFFVFQRTLSRSISTNSASTTCTIFNVITSIIRDDLMQSVRPQKRVKVQEVSGKFGVLVNAFEVVGVYLSKLTALIETNVAKQFAADDLIAIQMGLQELRTCGRQLEDELGAHLEAMTDKLSPAAAKLCEPFNSTIWMGAISVEHEAHLQKEFKTQFATAFADYKNCLNSSNYSTLMKKLAPTFALRLENVFMLKQFDASGAVLMARMVKWAGNFFGNPNCFRKLKDIGRVLTLQSPENISGIWGTRAEEGDPVILDINELKKIVKLRTDWRENDLGFLLI